MSGVIEVPVVKYPAMKHEAKFLRGRVERAVVFNLLLHLAANGWTVRDVDGGDEEQLASCITDAMEYIFDLDDCWVRFESDAGDTQSVRLVMGNDGPDVVSDWNYKNDDPNGFDACMNAFNGEAVVTALLGGGE